MKRKTLNIDKIIRGSREFLEDVQRERAFRGLPSDFIDSGAAAYYLAELSARARELGKIDGPNFLSPEDTISAEKIRDRINAKSFPSQREWIERILRLFGTYRQS